MPIQHSQKDGDRIGAMCFPLFCFECPVHLESILFVNGNRCFYKEGMRVRVGRWIVVGLMKNVGIMNRASKKNEVLEFQPEEKSHHILENVWNQYDAICCIFCGTQIEGRTGMILHLDRRRSQRTPSKLKKQEEKIFWLICSAFGESGAPSINTKQSLS